MNNENPLVPQGSLLEQKNKSRSRVKTAFFCVLAVHVLAILTALIAQGCNRRQPPVPYEEPQAPPPSTPAFDTNLPPVVDTNLPATPPATDVAPPVTETAPPPPPPSPTEYTVAAGDSFYSIGKRFGVSMKAIADANPGVDPTRLQVGQKLKLPAPRTPAAASAAAPGTPATQTAGEEVYVVKSGDTLTRIAAKFGTTVKALRTVNNLRTDRIKVGDKLRIPAKPAPPAGAAPATGTTPAAPEPAVAPPPVSPAPGN